VLAELGRRGYQIARRIVIALIGGTVVLVGVVMFVTPGPALVVIPIGLAILAIEFAFARRWLQAIKSRLTWEQLDELVNRSKWWSRKKNESPHGS
jgi:tellurite resistance protein TerC